VLAAPPEARERERSHEDGGDRHELDDDEPGSVARNPAGR
jgi:hypothetical protein